MNKIIQGDCLEVLKTLPDNSVDSIVTDPPYGVDYQSAWRTDKSKWKPKIANDKTPFVWWLQEAYRVLKDNSGLLCFTRYDTEQDFRWALRIAGFQDKAQVIWDKEIHGMGDLKGDFAPQHENIIFATKGRFTFPDKRPKSIMRCQRINAEQLLHPNEKPVELMRKLVKSITPVGGIVLDPFMGSGSTGIGAKLEGFSFLGIELDAKYTKIAEARIEAYNKDLRLFQ